MKAPKTPKQIYNQVWLREMTYSNFMNAIRQYYVSVASKQPNIEVEHFASKFCKLHNITVSTLTTRNRERPLVTYKALFYAVATKRFKGEDIAQYTGCRQANVSLMSRRFKAECEFDKEKRMLLNKSQVLIFKDNR
jgi:hypothetical protein